MPRKPKRHPGGRPTLYDSTLHPRLAKRILAVSGSIAEVAEIAGVNRDTIYRWMNQHPEFSDAVKFGRITQDADIAYSLYRKAKGHIKRIKRSSTARDGTVIEYQDATYYPPDTAAAIFWLCNRRPQDWQHVQKIEHAGTVNLAHWDLSKLTPAELEAMRALAKKAAPELEAAGDAIEVVEDEKEC